MNHLFTKILAVYIMVILLPAAFAIADNTIIRHMENGLNIESAQQSTSETKTDLLYNGRIRIYMVEPVSRWWGTDALPFEFGFLGFAFDTVVSMNYLDTLETTVIWNGAAVGFDDIEESNIMAIAAVFNSEYEDGYAHPPDGYYFEAYLVDAAASADYQNIWPNQVFDEFTHSVLVEIGTTMW